MLKERRGEGLEHLATEGLDERTSDFLRGGIHQLENMLVLREDLLEELRELASEEKEQEDGNSDG